MKYTLLLALSLSLGAMQGVWAEEVAPATTEATSAATDEEDPASVLEDLCQSYVKDGTIGSTEYNQCVSGLTALSEPATLVGEEPAPKATDTTADPATNPEALVKDEIVEKPDPQAEQLSVQ